MNPFVHPILMHSGDWGQMFLHFLMLSLLSIGGAVSTLPDMHRYLVLEQHWLNETQFNASVALAQAAPGPNVLFIALMGWNIGSNTGSLWTGLFGVLVAMTGIILPSATLTLGFASWSHQNRERLIVRSFKQGMSPVVIGLLFSTGWIMASTSTGWQLSWPSWLLTACAALIVWRTHLHLLYLLAAGALLGWVGWI